MKIRAWCKTDKGLKREGNQDSFLVNEDLGLFAVADGMGGHQGGEVASDLAVKTAEEVLRQKSKSGLSPRDIVRTIYEKASEKIFDIAKYERPELMGMGTTMVVLYKAGASLFIGNVGDSRCYLFRKPYLWQVTEDHSLVNEQLRAGVIAEADVENFIGKNVITRSVGYEREVSPDVLERPLQPGDCFLVCSDGLSGMVTDAEIQSILNRENPNQIVDTCIRRALEEGGDDNVTVMYLSVEN